MKNTIAIIGVGNMGRGFAKLFASSGLEVVIGARDITKAESLASELGNGIRGVSIMDAFTSADTIFLALPYAAMKEALKWAGDVSGKILIDISNPITDDYKGLLIGHTTSAAEEIQSLVPGAGVVKAFNTIFAGLLSKEARKDKILQVFIASDNLKAKEVVSWLAVTGGFEAVDAGSLSNSRFLEPIGEMNIHFGFFLGRGTGVAPSWIQV